MTWKEKKYALRNILNMDEFESEEHFDEWFEYNLECWITRKRINNAFQEYYL